jgi:hypothetical protein
MPFPKEKYIEIKRKKEEAALRHNFSSRKERSATKSKREKGKRRRGPLITQITLILPLTSYFLPIYR